MKGLENLNRYTAENNHRDIKILLSKSAKQLINKYWTMSSIPPPGTPCWESPPTPKHILFLNKNISPIREYYMNVYT